MDKMKDMASTTKFLIKRRNIPQMKKKKNTWETGWQ